MPDVMPDEMMPEPEVVPDENWVIEIHHSRYYRWEPVRADEVPPDAVTVDSYYEGFVMQRVTVDEPTTSTTTVHLSGLKQTNVDRKAAGLAPRSDIVNLIRELEDGPWPKQFPVDSITEVVVLAGPKTLAAKLAAHFIDTEDDE